MTTANQAEFRAMQRRYLASVIKRLAELEGTNLLATSWVIEASGLNWRDIRSHFPECAGRRFVEVTPETTDTLK